MKKIIIILIVIVIAITLYSAFSMSCEPGKFKIYYIPLEVEYFVPPTRDDIMQYGTSLEMSSCIISKIFSDIGKQDGIEPQLEDKGSLRIMIVNMNDGKEMFITKDKIVLSNNKKYNVDIKTIDSALKEIVDFMKTNNLKWG